eukprot:8470975-Heterocapsa_arctica.AAC.1
MRMGPPATSRTRAPYQRPSTSLRCGAAQPQAPAKIALPQARQSRSSERGASGTRLRRPKDPEGPASKPRPPPESWLTGSSPA